MKRSIVTPFIFLTALVMLFSCTAKIEGTGGTVSLTVNGYNEVLCENHSVTVEAGTTAFDVFVSVLRGLEIPFTVSGSGSNVYIKSVNGVKEFDHGPESGWIYTVNGENLSISCGSYQINDGDSITFKYITEYEDNI